MLPWFPTPLPKEWWFSVLSRAYVRTGITEHSRVKSMMFQGKTGVHIGTMFPNQTIQEIVSQLPSNLFDTRKIILENTPFLYYTRMYPMEERESMLCKLCKGEVFQLTHLWKSTKRDDWAPRFCPLCAKEDREKYGEPYWHVDHQIPLMTVCPEHRCALVQIKLQNASWTLNNQFMPLSSIDTNVTPDFCCKTSEEVVSRLVNEYWSLPYSVGRTEGHNNLIQTYKNNGYLRICKQGRITLELEKVYEDLTSFFGAEKVKEVFGSKLDNGIIKRLDRWEQLLPDRYILLQAKIGLPTDVVFSENAVPDDIREEMLRMSKQKVFRTKRQVANEMELKEYELNILTAYYSDLPPLYVAPLKQKHQRKLDAAIHISVSQQELEKLDAYRKKYRYRCVGHFALQCMRYVMSQDGDGNDLPIKTSETR